MDRNTIGRLENLKRGAYPRPTYAVVLAPGVGEAELVKGRWLDGWSFGPRPGRCGCWGYRGAEWRVRVGMKASWWPAWLVAGLFAAVVAGALVFLSATIWVPAVVVGLVGFGRVRLAVRRDLREPAALVKTNLVAGVGLGDALEGIQVTIDGQEVSRYENRRTALVFGAAGVVALVLAGLWWFSWGPVGFIGHAAVVAGPVIAAVLLALVAKYLGVGDVAEKLYRRVDEINLAFSDANAEASAGAELRRLSALAYGELEIEFPVEDHLLEIRAFVDSEWPRLLSEPAAHGRGELYPMLEDAREAISCDLRCLVAALGHLQAAETAHGRTARAVVGYPSLLAATDEVYAEIQRARTLLLPARDWRTFEEAMALHREELSELEAEPERASGAGSGAGYDSSKRQASPDSYRTADPYRVLGADPAMYTGQIKKLYRKLSAIYHPDAGLTADGEKFKELAGAWDEIRTERDRAGG